MKHLFLIFLAIATCGASPIVYTDAAAFSNEAYLDPVGFTVTGAATSISNGYFLSLYNVTSSGYYTSATFTSDEPLLAWGGFFDNAHSGAGTGMYVYADGVLVGSFGRGSFFQGYWGFQQETAFTTVTIATGVRTAMLYQEHLTLTGILAGYAPETPPPPPPIITTLPETERDSDPEIPSVPEPGTMGLTGGALIGMVMLRKKVLKRAAR